MSNEGDPQSPPPEVIGSSGTIYQQEAVTDLVLGGETTSPESTSGYVNEQGE